MLRKVAADQIHTEIQTVILLPPLETDPYRKAILFLQDEALKPDHHIQGPTILRVADLRTAAVQGQLPEAAPSLPVHHLPDLTLVHPPDRLQGLLQVVRQAEDRL